ncbi:MAG: aspartate ammonia-lyase [Gemmatimonadaceae bacterium]|nr:aspartate ammonia-lyase [Gemmatimonadaceae bacterium]
MTPQGLAEQLRGIEFFKGLPDTLLWHLARSGETVELKPDDVLFRQGDRRAAFSVILEGSVAIERVPPDGGTIPVRLATFGAGSVLGESVLLEPGVHGSSAHATCLTRILRFPSDVLDPVLRNNPALYAALVGCAARAIGARLHGADAVLAGRGRGVGFAGATRREHDFLGERDVPDAALYGVQTLRAIENFPITGVALYDFPELIVALAQVKEAAARANAGLGLLDPAIADAIVRAAREVQGGRHHEHFRVDMIQGGAGTSTNMNANEVLANRALELLGLPRGTYGRVHPNEHVNLSQSTNDVYPTSIKLALHSSISSLKDAMGALVASFLRKGEEFHPYLKMGRTQLQDAVPMTLGQEFSAFGHTIQEDIDRLTEAQALIREMNMGATAIGTGITAPHGYADAVRAHLSEVAGLPLITAPDLVEATADTGSFVQLSGVLKRCAVKLSKICNDLRLLSSGPRAGLGEINLPPMQPGSSIMPGKVNPVVPEVVNQVCFDIIGGDVTVTLAAEAGQLQLNVFEPVIAFRLLRNAQSLRNACTVLRERCVDGITANPERMRHFVEHSIGIVTALVPILGYEKCASVAVAALESGRGVYELVLERGLMDKAALDRALNPAGMTGEAS